LWVFQYIDGQDTTTDRMRCPVTVAWAQRESAEFARQSREFAEKLRAPMHIGNGVNHFEVIETLADARSPLARLALEMIDNQPR